MGEYAQRFTADGNPVVLDVNDNNEVIGTYYTGTGLNLQAGYLFKSNYEVAARYTLITPETISGYKAETEYGLALSRYVVGHKLKVQTDLGYRQIANDDDKLFWRVQVDIHF